MDDEWEDVPVPSLPPSISGSDDDDSFLIEVMNDEEKGGLQQKSGQKVKQHL